MVLGHLMLVMSRFRIPTGSSWQSPSIKHINRIMPASRVMEGGIGFTDSRSARQRWVVAGHEVAALSEDFENAH